MIRIAAKVLATIAVIAWVVPAQADLIDPNDVNLAPFTIQQGDFNTVALQWADTVYGGSKYHVQSGPGQIHNYVVPYTGSNGITNPAGMDNPYDATGDAHGTYYFQPGYTNLGLPPSGAGCTPNCTTFSDPGGAGQFTGDNGTTWDARTSTLNAALHGEKMVIYFNLNETKGGTDTLSGVDVLSWAAITLHDSKLKDGLADKTFYLDANGPATGINLASQGLGPDPSVKTCDVNPNTPYSGNSSCPTTLNANGTHAYGDPADGNADPRWTYVSGVFCVDPSGTGGPLGNGFYHYGSCDGRAGEGAAAKSVQNNVGQDQAAFAIWNAELDQIIANNGCVAGGCYDEFHADFRFSMLDNGPEQIFLASVKSTTVLVPEPSSIALLGAALAGLGWSVRRRRRSGGVGDLATQAHL